MSMAQGSKKHNAQEDAIFDYLSLYKVLKTNKGRVVAVHVDGSISMVIPFEGINNTSIVEQEFEDMFRRMQSTIDDVDPDDMSIQFVMSRDSNVGIQDSSHLPSYLRPRADYLNDLAQHYQLFVNRFYLSIHCQAKIQNKEGMITRLYNKVKYRKDVSYQYNKSMENIENRVTKVVEFADAMCQVLTDIGARYKLLDTEKQYYDIFQEFTRPSKSKIQTVDINNNDDLASPRQQLFSGVRASTGKNDFVLDDYYHRIYTLDRTPRDWIRGKSIDLIESVPFEFIYSVTFRTTSPKEALDTFKYKLAERRIAAGANENAIVEDRTLAAEEKRVSDSYDQFAYGDGQGIVMSVNFVMRVKQELIQEECRRLRISRDEMIRRLDQRLTKRVFTSFGGSEWINEEATSWPVFCALIPGCSTMFSEALKSLFVTSENIPYFFAMYDNQRADIKHNGTNHFVDMRGNRVNFDLMDPTLPAWNYSISGQTGSGKSVLVNALLTMQFADTINSKRPVICILDVGGDRGSYSKFMELVKGTQINLSRSVKPSIQMFELIAEQSVPMVTKIEFVAESIFKDKKEEGVSLTAKDKQLFLSHVREFYDGKLLMSPEQASNEFELKKLFRELFHFEMKPIYFEWFKLNPGEVIPAQKEFNLIMAVLEVILSTSSKQLDGFMNYDFDEVSEVVMETYKRTEGRYPMMSDLLAVAEDMVDESEAKGRKLLVKIKNYTKNGAYHMFDKPTSIDITNDVILTDLKGLEEEPQLQMIYTLLISKLYQQKMYFTRDRRKLIVRDEAWSLMQNEKARRFFVEDLRTARKNGFATIAISQLPTDYLSPNPQDGRAIISNFQVNMFCRFANETICREVAREYTLPEEMVDVMKDLGVQTEIQDDGSQKKTYAKFMMVVGKSIYILKNLLHPFEYALYSSSAEDNAVIEYYLRVKQSYTSLEDVLWLMAKNSHIGDMELANYLEEAGHKNMAARVRGRR